jgi:hypothetical protein
MMTGESPRQVREGLRELGSAGARGVFTMKADLCSSCPKQTGFRFLALDFVRQNLDLPKAVARAPYS